MPSTIQNITLITITVMASAVNAADNDAYKNHSAPSNLYSNSTTQSADNRDNPEIFTQTNESIPTTPEFVAQTPPTTLMSIRSFLASKRGTQNFTAPNSDGTKSSVTFSFKDNSTTNNPHN